MTDEEKPPAITPAPISVVLIAFNAEVSLEQEVSAWAALLSERGQGYELILVDDGSFDRTPAVAEGVAASHVQLRLLRHDTRRGFGAALRTGLAAAAHPLLCYAAAGGFYHPADLKPMLKWIDDVDLVAGHRVAEEGSRQYRTGLVSRLLARVLLGVHLRDLGCLFLLARRSVFARIPIQSDGPFAHVEVLAKANFLGCLMTEVPVGYRPPAPPQPSPWDFGRLRTRAEALRVFRKPDFGPVKLAEPPGGTP
jgi:glycosyltransferase involved in cell wall biosynthesis